jgi:hypothetical protein
MWAPGFDDQVYSTTYSTSLLHFTSHRKSLLLSVFCVLSSHADWTLLLSLGLTADWLLPWSLHVSDLTAQAECWQLTARSLSKSTLLRRSSGLVREHLVQGLSLSSTQHWLAYSVAVGTQQFGLCCLGRFLGSVYLCVRCHWNTRSYCIVTVFLLI